MFRYTVLFLMILGACATPKEQCERAATKDLQVVDELIAETKTNLERGYGTRRDVEPTVRVQFCAGNRRRHTGLMFCNYPTTRVVERPVAIDLDEERRKLVSLEEQRRRLLRRASDEVAACNARYAEG